MFSVVFEVHPKSSQWDAYLGHAKRLKPVLEQMDGFIDNTRYRSLTRDGWLVSLSTWRDEKSLVRWRTQADHHRVQHQGRLQVFEDYHLRVGEIVSDTAPPAGQIVRNQRLDETETGRFKYLALIEATWPREDVAASAPEEIARRLWNAGVGGLQTWEVFDAVLAPGDILLIIALHDADAAAAVQANTTMDKGTRLRTLRVVRDYGMHDRREAPQYYAENRVSGPPG
jgi:heme-degrading monooxygenase HmoA